jgi:YfiR/HmsC-like
MRRRVLALLVAALLAVTSDSVLAALAATEYQVKAVYLFNFSQFVTWPAQAFGGGDAPIVIAVLGHDPFGADLDSVVSGEHVGPHPLLIRRIGDVSQIKDCHILFIDRSEKGQLSQILMALRGRSILTVSDIDEAARSGVMIDLVKDGGRVRMRINVDAAHQSGLTLSSKLLRPAEIVGPPGE